MHVEVLGRVADSSGFPVEHADEPQWVFVDKQVLEPEIPVAESRPILVEVAIGGDLARPAFEQPKLVVCDEVANSREDLRLEYGERLPPGSGARYSDALGFWHGEAVK
jgi:hypothetical protein